VDFKNKIQQRQEKLWVLCIEFFLISLEYIASSGLDIHVMVWLFLSSLLFEYIFKTSLPLS
jgi:hypothetical protein